MIDRDREYSSQYGEEEETVPPVVDTHMVMTHSNLVV